MTAKEPVKALYAHEKITAENSSAAMELYEQARYGTLNADGSLQLSTLEAVYLSEKGRLEVYDGKKARIPQQKLLVKAKRAIKNFATKYSVYRDIRNRGYIIKTALKFGADFRVYERGVKPGEDHAKWIVYPVQEAQSMTWYEFAAKNRVAHSTKKRLLIAVVDEEGDVSYWEVRWIRP